MKWFRLKSANFHGSLLDHSLRMEPSWSATYNSAANLWSSVDHPRRHNLRTRFFRVLLRPRIVQVSRHNQWASRSQIHPCQYLQSSLGRQSFHSHRPHRKPPSCQLSIGVMSDLAGQAHKRDFLHCFRIQRTVWRRYRDPVERRPIGAYHRQFHIHWNQ